VGRLVAACALLASSSGLLGCVSNEVASKPCEAITQSGEAVHPNSYPLGAAAVKFQESRIVFNVQDETEGVIIIDEDERFFLVVKGLPNKLANDYTAFSGTDAAVILETPDTGIIGLTSGCIVRTRHANGIPTSHIELPSA
jgi:hypothetical protein